MKQKYESYLIFFFGWHIVNIMQGPSQDLLAEAPKSAQYRLNTLQFTRVDHKSQWDYSDGLNSCGTPLLSTQGYGTTKGILLFPPYRLYQIIFKSLGAIGYILLK